MSIRDPSTGCGSPSCAPCTLFKATTLCTPTGQCAIAACIESFRDCDQLAETGCETDIDHDPGHCGDCHAAPCSTDNGLPGCSAGHCTTGSCKTNFGDCNADPSDGCETDLRTSSDHCGSCDMKCPSGRSCVRGQCM